MAESLAVDYTQVRYPNRGAVRNVDALYKGLSGLPAAMQQMGYKELRPGQKEAIWEIMAERDTLCILATSYGKSCVFQLSTLAMGWRTIIFSPLVALMRDQVQKLERLRIPAAQMSGLQSDGQNSLAARQWAHGELSFLYVAPERLDNPEFKAALQAVQPDMVTIDECFPGDYSVNTEFGPRTFADLYQSFTAGHAIPKLACSDDTGKQQLRSVKNVWKREPKELFTVSVDYFGFYEATADHPAWTQRGWVNLKDLRVNSDKVWVTQTDSANSIRTPTDAVKTTKIDTQDQKCCWATVKSVTPSKRQGCDLYDIEVDELHNFNVFLNTGNNYRTGNTVKQHNCHVISGWSDNFRPSYTRIGDLIRETKPKVVSAFTATFPERVESDVRRVLCMGDAIKVVNCPRRTNLKLKSRDMGELQNVMDYIEERVASHGSVLVYCATIKNAEELVRHLQASTKLEVGLYHGELTDAQKKGALDSFMEDYSQVMVATNAFGMGVDKGNIYTIVHRDMPGSPESIDQEVGRAGRNGKDAECMMFVDPKSINTQRFFIMNAHPSKAEITQVFHALNKMKDSEGKILASHNDIAQNAPGVHPMAVSAAMQAMKAADVLLSNRASGKFGKVNFIGNSEDPKFKAFRSCVVRIGRLTDEGPYEVEPTKLADALAVKVATAQSHLRSWREKGLIDYIPPMRGSEIWMKGGLERVEFARLEQARNEAYEKLDKVLAYVKTPDSQKHAFLADYFQADRP